MGALFDRRISLDELNRNGAGMPGQAP